MSWDLSCILGCEHIAPEGWADELRADVKAKPDPDAEVETETKSKAETERVV